MFTKARVSRYSEITIQYIPADMLELKNKMQHMAEAKREWKEWQEE